MKSNTWLIVGLGNIGDQFDQTRHNTGFEFLNWLVDNTSWTNHKHFVAKQFQLAHQNIIAIKPTTLMNLSGKAVKAACEMFKIKLSNVIIIADDVDFKLGQVKFNLSLNVGSHNGLKSIDAVLTNKIKSIHIGINRQTPLHSWVLTKFKPHELTLLQVTFPNIKQQLINFWSSNIPFATKINQTSKVSDQKQSKSRKMVVVGGLFGDEGKGKIVDYYASQFDIIARFAGGDNAGHTVKVDKQIFQFSILPVAMIRPDKISFLGAGCLINLTQLCFEINQLKQTISNIGQLRIAARAHIILPYHLLIDQQEESTKTAKIGTTKRGIGPCAADRVNRIGIQVADLFDPILLKGKLNQNLKLKNPLLKTKLTVEKIFDQLMQEFAQIKPFVVDSVQFWHDNANKSILFEGAQGTLLDVQYGIYPFVTSTSPLTWQAGLGTGANIQKAQFLGVFKAYTTRVGTGPLPTTINDESLNDQIAKVGNEYGVVSKRRRRIGWFDAVLARYSIKINHFHQIAITLLDVLSVCDQIKICTHYLIDKQKFYFPPTTLSSWDKIEPQYITLSGWNQTDFSKIKSFHELPYNAQLYIRKIEELLKIRVAFISIGKERNATIVR